MSPPKDSKAAQTGLVSKNRRAHFDYELGDRYEAGVVLLGSEVRSLRENPADLSDAWVDVQSGEAMVKGLRIPKLVHAAYAHADETRPRKLLLHKSEIERLYEAATRERMTLVVTRLYFKQGRVKVELAVARGKQKYDKRQALKERDADREARNAMRRFKS